MSSYKIDKLFNYEKGLLQSTKCTPGEFNFITASADWKTHSTYTHDCEALVFAAAASGSLGRTHYINGKFIASDLCFVLTPKDPNNFPIDLGFYHIIFNLIREDIVRNTKAGTSKEAIGLSRFGNYELPYFDIYKQKEIKNKFIRLEQINDSILEENSSQQKLISQLRQSFLREAMQGKLTSEWRDSILRSHPELVSGSSKSATLSDGTLYEPASELLKKIKAEKAKLIAEGKLKKQKPLPEIKPEEIPYEIPASWVWCRLGKVCINIMDGTHNSPINSHTGKFKYITAKNIKDEGIDLSDITYISKEAHTEIYAKCNPEKGDILFIKDGATTGVVTINNLDEQFSLLSSVALLKLPEIVLNKYLMYAIRSPFYYDATRKDMFGVAITRVNLIKINNSIVPIPPYSEQQRIVSKLEELMRLCDELEKNINQTKAQTNLLLQTVLKEALLSKDDERSDTKEIIQELALKHEKALVKLV